MAVRVCKTRLYVPLPFHPPNRNKSLSSDVKPRYDLLEGAEPCTSMDMSIHSKDNKLNLYMSFAYAVNVN